MSVDLRQSYKCGSLNYMKIRCYSLNLKHLNVKLCYRKYYMSSCLFFIFFLFFHGFNVFPLYNLHLWVYAKSANSYILQKRNLKHNLNFIIITSIRMWPYYICQGTISSLNKKHTIQLAMKDSKITKFLTKERWPDLCKNR